MKNKKKKNLVAVNLFLPITLTVMSALIVAIIVLNILYQDKSGWISLLLKLLENLLATSIIGTFIGLVTKIVTDKLFTVQISMKKLKEAGVQGIGPGIFTRKDARNFFGNPLTKQYPKVIKMMFITGYNFISFYKDAIIDCLKVGCEIQLLLASPIDNNAYLERLYNLDRSGENNPKPFNTVEEINDTLRILSDINEKCKDCNGKLIVRFFRDEHKYNIRIAQYKVNQREVYHFWLGLSPINSVAINYSISLYGKIDTDKNSDDMEMLKGSENGFDYLWRRYEETERYYCEYVSQLTELNHLFDAGYRTKEEIEKRQKEILK